jgi:hypothetical protein
VQSQTLLSGTLYHSALRQVKTDGALFKNDGFERKHLAHTCACAHSLERK